MRGGAHEGFGVKGCSSTRSSRKLMEGPEPARHGKDAREGSKRVMGASWPSRSVRKNYLTTTLKQARQMVSIGNGSWWHILDIRKVPP